MDLSELIRQVGRAAIAQALGKKGTRADQMQISRYGAGGRPLSLTQAARLRRAFPELDLNEAAEALLVLEEERDAGGRRPPRAARP